MTFALGAVTSPVIPASLSRIATAPTSAKGSGRLRLDSNVRNAQSFFPKIPRPTALLRSIFRRLFVTPRSQSAPAGARQADSPVAQPAMCRAGFTRTRRNVCDEMIERYKNAFNEAATGLAWPSDAMEEFKWFHEKIYETSLAASPQTFSMNDLHEAHHEAIDAAPMAAIQKGIVVGEIDDASEKMFTGLLTALRTHINVELRLRADPRVTGLFRI